MRLRLYALMSALFITAGAMALPSPASAALTRAATATPQCQATAAFENSSHNGFSCTTLPAVPVKKWRVRLNGSASYPLIAGGKVFVVTGTSSGSWLYALNASSGTVAWGPVPLTASSGFSLAYGNHRLYVGDFDGVVTAYAAGTGRQVWTQATNSNFAGAVVAYNGVVYFQGAGPVLALSQQTGQILWQSAYLDGDGSSVSANASGVYVAAGCSWFRLSLATGAVDWSGNSGCTGGGGGTTYLSNGSVFETVNGLDLIVNAATGKTRGSFSGTPAFAGTNGYFAIGSSIYCENVKTLTPVFTAQLPAAISTSPVIAGQTLYVAASNSRVYALNATTGKRIWRGWLPGVPGQTGLPGIAVGQNLLVVPTGSTVTAFG
jgi:outer membrane protein assembly factor BamB